MQAIDLPVVQPAVVRKRDGRTTQPFDVGKIESAVRKAWFEAEGSIDEEELHRVATFVAATLPETADVEQIQDIVEVALMRAKKFGVAKAFIIYRQKRTEARAARRQPDVLAVSDYIHASKYARYVPELQRREVYLETVERVEAMHLRRFADHEVLLPQIKRAFQLVREKKVLPSMRSMQFGGRAVEVNHNRQYNCSATLIDRPRAFAEAMFLLLSGCGVGYSVQFDHVEKLPPLADIDEKKVIHHVVEDTIEGWANALDALVNSYIGGYNIEFSFHKIRDAGAQLKTSGGRAPGHLKLKLALDRVRSVLHSAQGRKLRPIECHRILCHAADAVLSGGIRRSAMICLFSLEDSELMHVKADRDWYSKEPWLANANNSVVLKRDEVKEKQFKRIFGMTKNFGEPGVLFVSDYSHVTNPCAEIGLDPVLVREDGTTATGWAMCNLCEINAAKLTSYDDFKEAAWAATLIGTMQATYTDMPFLGKVTEAIVRRDALLGIGMTGMQDSPAIACDPDLQREVAGMIVEWNAAWAKLLGINPAARTTCVKPSGCRPWDSLTVTDRGVLTMEELFANHPTGETWAPIEGLSAVQDGAQSRLTKTFDNGLAEVLEVEMSFGLVVRSTRNHPWRVRARHAHDGTSRWTPVDAWIPAGELRPGDVLDVAIAPYRSEHVVALTAINPRTLTMRSNVLPIAMPTVMDDDLAWLAGYLWGDGAMSISKYRLRFVDGNRLTIAKAARIIEEKFGLRTSVTELSDRDAASLEVASKHLWLWCVRNGLEKYAEAETLNAIPRCVRGSSWRHIVAFAAGLVDSDGCVSPTTTGSRVQVSSATESFARHFQQVMWSVGLGFGRSLQSQGESFQAERHLYHLVLAAGPTDRDAFAHLVSCSVKCSMHMLDSRFVEWQMDKETKRGRQIAGKVREVRSLGVMPTFDVEVESTHWFYDGAVKSHNTTSLELGNVGSGIHPHHARRYIRRVTADELEVVFQAFKQVNPHMCVRRPDGKWMLEFPVQAPDNAVLKEDLTAEQFMEMVRSTQQHWVVPGATRPSHMPGLSHNVSNTITVGVDEWATVADYLWDHRSDFTGVSLLPDSGDMIYAFAPFEAVKTEAQERRWNELVAKYVPVDYLGMFEAEDGTSLTSEAACAGGACQLA